MCFERESKQDFHSWPNAHNNNLQEEVCTEHEGNVSVDQEHLQQFIGCTFDNVAIATRTVP